MATDSSDHEKQDWMLRFCLMCCKENSPLNLENSLMQNLHSGNNCCISVTESGTTRSALKLTRGEDAYIILTLG